MDLPVTPKKKIKSPTFDPSANISIKTSVTCTDVPEALLDGLAAKKHFSKFGRVQKIRLFPKKRSIIVVYDLPSSVEKAVLNGGAYDGFMFDVTRTKARVRRRSKVEDDPDWVPDSDVEQELSAMSGAPTYRVTRQKPMEIESPSTSKPKHVKQIARSPVRSKLPVWEKRPMPVPASTSGRESPVVPPTQTSMSTAEAASELNQLRFRVSVTPDEQWRTLDARDRILRAWGGAGSRVKMGGATIGTCPDMCPEKELLHRQAEHQVMTLETVPESDGQLEPWRAVKQYSRSSADQEIPMCYELRPARVLMRTCAYLLHEIADTQRQVTLADWFHFMWDRLRGIRKDIAQQALCCAESIRLVEMCARFHAHCAARLADLEHTQFDQKLNTDNLTKCLQTLKHMYADAGPDLKPCEAEFRGYIALLNLGDANFWWEIKQLPLDIQKSRDITFAMRVFNALDNNNYVRFFRLVKEQATYLQACILLRYFNDVRARALARIVKAYAPRGGSKYPAEDLIKSLSFESAESMKGFITHYGLRIAKDEYELSVILDRNQFIEDSEPYPIARAVKLIESKRKSTVGEVIAGGTLPNYDYTNHTLYTSFHKDGKLKEAALIAEEQGYNTINDSNKDIKLLKSEIQKLAHSGRSFGTTERIIESKPAFMKPESSFGKPTNVFAAPAATDITIHRSFSFKPAIPVAPTDVIKSSPEKVFGADVKNVFSFSKPQDTVVSNNMFVAKDAGNLFKPPAGTNIFGTKPQESGNLFMRKSNENKDPSPNTQHLFKKPDDINVFKKPDSGKSIFGQVGTEANNGEVNKNLFANATSQNVFGKNVFAKDNEVNHEKPINIFAKAVTAQENIPKSNTSNIFGAFNKPNSIPVANNLFAKPEGTAQSKSIFAANGDVSPGTLFKSAATVENKTYSIFQSKNKAPSVADTIFNSVNAPQSSVFEFNQNDHQTDVQQNDTEQDMERKLQERLREEEERKELKRREEERIKEEERRKEEAKRKEEERRKEEQRRQEEERRKQEELRRLEEKRRKDEERRQEELKRKLEDERKAEIRRLAEEAERQFKERVEKESEELTEELLDEVRNETVRQILTEEMDKMKKLISYAGVVTEEIWTELCDEISCSEITAEKFWTDKLKKKWFSIWKSQFHRNFKRRCLLDDTPVWLTDKTPVEEASCLRRPIENAALRNMNAIHRGYVFTGELRQLPAQQPYNVVEIIRSPLLKGMKLIKYPYDKCFFWKVTLVSPGESKWLSRKLEIENWILSAFSDKKTHISDSLIRVEKQSWNHLMDFAISVSITSPQMKNMVTDAVDGTNGIVFYTTENDHGFITTIEETLKQKYPYHVVPVTVIMPNLTDSEKYNSVEQTLATYKAEGIISSFKIFILDSNNIFDSLNINTKSALKWMAKKYPPCPPLEVDYLKSICQRYLGNEIWHRLKSETDGRINNVLRDLHKLVKCYNLAVDKLTEVITNEDLFNYPSFPLELKEYLDQTSPFPKPYEFIPTNARNSENTSAIRDMMNKLKLPNPVSEFLPIDIPSMQNQMRNYCNQIGWFENTEQVVCKIVAKLPTAFAEIDMPCEEFSKYFEHYDLIDFLNILVYEKINSLQNFDNRFVVYERYCLETYRNMHWLLQTDVMSSMKHKAVEYEDDLDIFIETKRRKIAEDSMEYLMLEDNDCTIVEESIKVANESISSYSDCKAAVKQLEAQIDLERHKSMELENLLKSALSNV